MKKREKKFVVLISSLLVALLSFKGQLAAQWHVAPKAEPAESQTSEEYRIHPLDILEIIIYMEDDLQKHYRVSQTGHVTYPFAGKIKVIDLTVSELEKKLTSLLSPDYFIDPQISIFIDEYHSRRIFVLGAVDNPGSYTIPPEKELSVVEAISLAGGFTKVARTTKIKVVRIEGGKEKSIEVDVKEITKHGDKSKDVKLKPNDIVIVPERFL